MKNDTVRIQSNQIESTRGSDRGRETRMDGSKLRLQSSLTDETYSDGFIDYTHEIW